jgi:dTDP-4-amino-4,6-dideoxygalactose transaminase
VLLADVESRSLTPDLQSVRERISDATRAIVVSHALGYCASLDAFEALARQAGALLIEDCGSAFGARSPRGLLGAGPHPCLFELGAGADTGHGAAVLVTWPAAGPAELRELARAGRLARDAAARAGALLAGAAEQLAARARHAAFYNGELGRYDAFHVRGNPADRPANFACYPLGITGAARACAEDLHRLLLEVGIETRLLPSLFSERVLCESPRAERARESTLLLPLHAELTPAMRDAVLDALYDYAIG